ncbi:rhombosortase [Cupriavidus basilensis]
MHADMHVGRRRAAGGWLLLALALVALQAAGPALMQALRFDREAMLAGQAWRLLSCHFVHLGWTHCLLNVAGLLMLAAILPARMRAWQVVPPLAAMTGLLLLAGEPELLRYAGFSGINYGLAMVALLPRARCDGLAAMLLLALAARAGWQILAGPAEDEGAWLGGPVVASAHLYGLAAGAWLAWPRREAPAMARRRPDCA